MNDKIYQLLNNDASELPEAETMSNQEVNNIMKRFREENNAQPIKKTRKPKMSAVILAAVISAACVGTATVAAAKLGVFSTLSSQEDRTYEENGEEYLINKWVENYDYDKIAENAAEAQESLIGEGENLVVEVDEVYCDGVTTLISLTGHLKDGNPDHKRLLKFYPMSAEYNGIRYDQSYDTADLRCDLMLDEGADNQFSGEIKLIDFGAKEITEEGILEIKVGKIQELSDYTDYPSPKESDGFNISVPVSPDRSLRIGADKEPYTIEEDGYSVKFYEISPAMAIVGFYPLDPEMSTMVYQENGEVKEFIGLSKLPNYNGEIASCMVPTNETLTVSFFDKSGTPNEDGYFPSIKEITINMEDIYASMNVE